MLMSNILAPQGSTLLSGAPLSWQSFVARELVATATPDGGHVIYLCDDVSDGVTAVRQYGAWEKIRNRKTQGPHLAAITYYGIRSVQELAKLINGHFAEYDVWPRIVVRDVSRKLSPMMPSDHWLAWLPELSRLAPAQYLTVTHTGIRGTAVTHNQKPFTATWTLADGHENGPAGPRERVGERWNLLEVPGTRIIKLHGHSYPGDVLFDLYEKPKEKVS
jgi:hypothetical protein